MHTTPDGKINLHWWTNEINFGDLLAPWLAEKISGREVEFAERGSSAYVTIGSILSHVSDGCTVWGTGSFGTETTNQLARDADYRAVRGPLTRNKLTTNKIDCPRIYGDPALLTPRFYHPDVEKKHKLGIVLRWSETKRNQHNIPGVKPIHLGSDDIEGTIRSFLECEKILTTSLHGLIIADAYGIPNAWLDSKTPKGLEFKYWDYLISVDKVRHPQSYKLHAPGLTANQLIDAIDFDERPINIDLDSLYEACPFKP
ncbi:polysaccharide pyruvyl transferase family protein [Brevibacterium oceani]|uniref:polysaccharide pyruvyl transferase family protein n=1 Tax=Brevibacterium oceani TaxID=358099 RepID=UPI0015E6B80B|nr:polysaccharide pyruvyl transferase family protein [Brevibacterium oceani]